MSLLPNTVIFQADQINCLFVQTSLNGKCIGKVSSEVP